MPMLPCSLPVCRVVRMAFALTLLLAHPSLRAQWTYLDGPYGAPVNDVATVGVAVWAATAAGVHRSTDGGHTWSLSTSLSANAVLDIAVLGDTVAVLTPQAVHLSTDGGQAWQAPIALPVCNGEPPARLRMLGTRMDIAERIGDHKREHQVAILQPERWERIMRRQMRLAQHLGLSDAFVKELMDAIHRESIRRQTAARSETAPPSGSPASWVNGVAE